MTPVWLIASTIISPKPFHSWAVRVLAEFVDLTSEPVRVEEQLEVKKRAEQRSRVESVFTCGIGLKSMESA
jgi:hypothetical protein